MTRTVLPDASGPALRRSGHLGALLSGAAAIHGERPYLVGAPAVDGLEALTYGETLRRVEGLAAALWASGVRRGDRVMVLAGNRPEVVIAAFAAARVGAAFAVLHPGIRPFGLEGIVAGLEPAAVLLAPETAELAAAALPPGGSGKVLLWVGEGASPAEVPESVVRLDLRQVFTAGPGGAAETDTELPAPGDPSLGIDLDPACLVYTSGSTGTPRGVVLSHDNLLFVVEAIAARLGYRPEDRVGVFLPLSFDYGFYQVLLAARAGATLFLGGADLAGPRLLGVLEAEEISVLPAVPGLVAGLLKLLARRPRALPRLRMVTNTGAHLPKTHIERLEELFPGLEVFPMYGLTECKRVSIALPAEARERPGTVGRPLDGTEVRVVGGDGRPLPPGEVGELVVRGRHVALGYWRAPEATRARFRLDPEGLGRVLHTGDLGSLDADGFLYFAERADHLVKHRGFRVSPQEIEEAACTVAGVAEAGVAAEAGRDRLHLYFTAEDGSEAGAGLEELDLLRRLQGLLEPHKVPEEAHRVAALPKTGNGKLDRKALAAWAEPDFLGESLEKPRDPGHPSPSEVVAR